MEKTYQNYIDGQWVTGSGKTFEVLNPATDKPIAKVPDGGSADVDRAVAAAKRAQPAESSFSLRSCVPPRAARNYGVRA